MVGRAFAETLGTGTKESNIWWRDVTRAGRAVERVRQKCVNVFSTNTRRCWRSAAVGATELVCRSIRKV